jgi:hypothetical protein
MGKQQLISGNFPLSVIMVTNAVMDEGSGTGVEDTIPATDKEIEFYRALMCVCPTLPIQQKLVFNDLTNVEDNTSLIESTVYPNPSSRYFTVQGQAFTQSISL